MARPSTGTRTSEKGYVIYEPDGEGGITDIFGIEEELSEATKEALALSQDGFVVRVGRIVPLKEFTSTEVVVKDL